MKQTVRAVDEARDAVLLGLRGVNAGELLRPTGIRGGLVVIEESRVHDGVERNAAVLRPQDARIRVQMAENPLELCEIRAHHEIGLRDDEHIRELHLIDEQVDDRRLVWRAHAA
jgi:hypothetical protein